MSPARPPPEFPYARAKSSAAPALRPREAVSAPPMSAPVPHSQNHTRSPTPALPPSPPLTPVPSQPSLQSLASLPPKFQITETQRRRCDTVVPAPFAVATADLCRRFSSHRLHLCLYQFSSVFISGAVDVLQQTHPALTSLHPHLPHQKSQNLRILFNNLTHRTPFAMPQFRIIQEQNRFISALRRLHRRRHFPRMQRSHARVAVSRQKQHRRIFRSRRHMVIRRIGKEGGELPRILRRSVFRDPILRHQKILITHHIQQRIPAHNRAEKFRPLRHCRPHQQSAVAAPGDRQSVRARVLIRDQPFRRREKIIEHVLLFLQHPRAMPVFPELPSAALTAA